MILRELAFFSGRALLTVRPGSMGEDPRISPHRMFLKVSCAGGLSDFRAACAYTYVCSALCVQGKEVRIHDGK